MTPEAHAIGCSPSADVRSAGAHAVHDTVWVRVTTADSIPVREGREVCIGDRHIAVFNLGARFAALDNRCPHKSGPLCDGIVAGASVVCPLHGWKISLDSGMVERPPGASSDGVDTYPTRVDDGILSVGVPAVSRV